MWLERRPSPTPLGCASQRIRDGGGLRRRGTVAPRGEHRDLASGQLPARGPSGGSIHLVVTRVAAPRDPSHGARGAVPWIPCGLVGYPRRLRAPVASRTSPRPGIVAPRSRPGTARHSLSRGRQLVRPRFVRPMPDGAAASSVRLHGHPTITRRSVAATAQRWRPAVSARDPGDPGRLTSARRGMRRVSSLDITRGAPRPSVERRRARHRPQLPGASQPSWKSAVTSENGSG